MTQEVETAELTALNNEAANLKEASKPMYGIHYGSQYEDELDVVEIAKLVRGQLKQLAKAKHSPLYGAKGSVRINRYSMGQSIDATVGLPFPIDAEEGQTGLNGFPAYYNLKAGAAKNTAQEILDSYNFDGSDSMTDYYHVNFAGHVRINELKE